MADRPDTGASVPDQALVASDEAGSRLHPSGFDPSRDSIWFGPISAGEDERIEDLLTGNVICGQCGATLQTYPTKCRVPYEAPCAGFLCVEGARLHLRRRDAIAIETRQGGNEVPSRSDESADPKGIAQQPSPNPDRQSDQHG